jgi:hypothetical protein
MQCPSRETEDEMLCLVRSEHKHKHKHKAQATTKCCSASDDTLMTVRMNVPTAGSLEQRNILGASKIRELARHG